jgi:hypothetical protein
LLIKKIFSTQYKIGDFDSVCEKDPKITFLGIRQFFRRKIVEIAENFDHTSRFLKILYWLIIVLLFQF